MGAPRRKLPGAFVLLTAAVAATAWAGPPIRDHDCGILGEDVITIIDAVRLSSPGPSSSPEVKLKAGTAVRFVAKKGDRVLVDPIPALSACTSAKRGSPESSSWVLTSSIRYVRLASIRGVTGVVVMPEQLKAYGKAYPSSKICANHLFTESASFYFTGDEKLPLAVLCTGQLDGESSTLSLLGPREAMRSKTLEPREGSTSIDDAVLTKAIDSLIRAQGQ